MIYYHATIDINDFLFYKMKINEITLLVCISIKRDFRKITGEIKVKLKFENWINSQNYPEEASVLFSESILCYKIGAYRASIIMSYLGMQTVIRKRVLIVKETPEKLETNKWNLIQKNLKNESEWDKEVYELANRNIDKNPFQVSDDIRKQYEYWRTIRNTCAHAKDDKIDSAHVDTFWLFIESCLNKYIINGGKNYIKNEILKHLNPDYTAPGISIRPLIDKIQDYIHNNELINFFEELIKEIHKNISENEEVLCSSDKDFELWNEINSNSRPILKKHFHEVIKNNDSYIRFFINQFPEVIKEFNDNSCYIRNLWKVKYWEWEMPWSANDWDLFMYLLKNGYIHSTEINEYFNVIRKHLGNFPPKEYEEQLKIYGYFQIVEKIIFSETKFSAEGSFNYCNNHINDFIKIMKINGLNKHNVFLLNRELRLMSFGSFVSGMKDFFKKNENLKEEFLKIVEDNDYELAPIFNEA